MMKRIVLKLAICVGLLSPVMSRASQVWKEVSPASAPRELQLIKPDQYKVFLLDEATLRIQFNNLPSDSRYAEVVSLPMPDGSMRDFRVWESSMMPADLAQQNPDIRTFTGTAVDDPTVGAKLDFTLYGFHLMVYDGEHTAFIDPYDNFHDGLYLAYYKKDLSRPEEARMKCGVHSGDEYGPGGESMSIGGGRLPGLAQKTLNGYDLRTYRLFVACSNQYAKTVTGNPSPTKPEVLSKITTTMNRVNGIYEREFSITMTLISAESSVINITATGDPFNAIDGNGSACLTANQNVGNTTVGNANYDIGHVFTTASGGIATLGCVCTFNKAQGTTGSASPAGDAFDVDYVAHEMGHQFGAQHTFNGIGGSCVGNGESATAFEPGSGSTILAYAGICAENVQPHSDPYFHRASLEQILTFVSGTGNCATKTATGNKFVKYDAFSPISYSIPYMTPFELTAPVATDSAGDSVVLYCWEEADLGNFPGTFASTSAAGPLFRSINPSKSNVRVFPKIASVLAGNLNTAYEKAPTVARSLKFKCTYRNIRNNRGCVTIPDEMITLNAVTTGTGAGFKVTSQGTPGTVYTGGSTQTVTWDVLNTAAAPIGATNVDIYMSYNGGQSYQFFLGTFPNSGSASVTVANPAASTTTARFKVKGTNNVFFNVNSVNFTVNTDPTKPISFNGASSVMASANDIKVFPVPADQTLHITVTDAADASVFNTIGQVVWQGTVADNADINVSAWAKGMYYMRFVDKANGSVAVKQVVIR